MTKLYIFYNKMCVHTGGNVTNRIFKKIQTLPTGSNFKQ